MDISLLSIIAIVALAGLGLIRGVRSEGITLAGVMAAAVVFSNDSMRGAVLGFINRMPRLFQALTAPEGSVGTGSAPVLIGPGDGQLVFYLACFLLCTGIFYAAGWRFGGGSAGPIERLLGGVMGGLSGFVVNVTLLNFSAEYFGRNPSVGPLAVELPTVVAPTLPTQNYLAGYAPMVFLAGFGVVAAVIVFSVVRR